MNASSISITKTARASRLLAVSTVVSGFFLHGILVLADDHSHHEAMQEGVMVEESNFGKPGKVTEVARTIEVSMGNDMRFTPDNIEIKQGETIRFIVKNTGSTPHEMILGTADEIREHADMMKKMPTMQHTAPSMIRVQPGQSGEIIWNLDLAGDFQFACLIPGHREAGMIGSIHVTEAPTK